MKLNKIIKWGMVALIIISVVLLVWGFVSGFETNDGQAVNLLLYWAYGMLGLAVACWVILGTIKSAANDPKSLVKLGIILAGAAVVCAIAFVLAPGNAPMAYSGKEQTVATLKLTDTILNLTYIAGGAAIVAIIVGEIRMSIASKK